MKCPPYIVRMLSSFHERWTEKMTRADTPSWLIVPRANAQARLQLFCFPFAGGGASLFRMWPDALPSTVEVCAIQLPGRENRMREPPLTRITDVVDMLATNLGPRITRPFALFGPSLGALISFELARKLRQQHCSTPICLFVSGRRAPRLPDPYPPLHDLPEPLFLARVRHRYNGIPQQVLAEPELMQLFLPTLRADLTLLETYTYHSEAPLDCPISAFGGTHDEQATYDALLAWREETNSTFSVRVFPGDHFFVRTAPGLLLQTLATDLQAITRTL